MESAHEAYCKAVRTLFPGLSLEERHKLIAAGAPEAEAAGREAAYAKVRAAIVKKTPPPPKDWITAAETSVYIGKGGSPRNLSKMRSEEILDLPSEIRTKKRDSKRQGLAGKGSGTQRRYKLSEVKRWVAARDAAEDAADAASSRQAPTPDRLDVGIRITTLQQLLEQLPWLVRDNKLRSSLLITRLTEGDISEFFADGGEVAWFSLHEALTVWKWDSPADRWPWAEGYSAVLDTGKRECERLGERSQIEAAQEATNSQFNLAPAKPGPPKPRA